MCSRTVSQRAGQPSQRGLRASGKTSLTGIPNGPHLPLSLAEIPPPGLPGQVSPGTPQTPSAFSPHRASEHEFQPAFLGAWLPPAEDRSLVITPSVQHRGPNIDKVHICECSSAPDESISCKEMLHNQTANNSKKKLKFNFYYLERYLLKAFP